MVGVLKYEKIRWGLGLFLEKSTASGVKKIPANSTHH
jgi:hypothetical protein